MASAFSSSSETRMTAQCRQALYFRLQAGYGFFGNAGISARENFKRETVQYRGPVGPDTVAKRWTDEDTTAGNQNLARLEPGLSVLHAW